MKYSIKNIFNNLFLFLLFMTFFAGFSALVSLEQRSSYLKTDNLNNQKQIASALTKLSQESMELTLIEFNGKSTQLHINIEKLRNMYQYNFVEQIILLNSAEYLSDLDKLTSKTTLFNDKARNYYFNNKIDLNIKEEELKKSFDSLIKEIDSIIFKNIFYDKAKFNLYSNVSYVIFIVVLLAAIWFRKKLNHIYSNIIYLYDIDKNNSTISFKEIAAISLRMKRKPDISTNPSMLDPVTGINNVKGMMNSYSEKKDMKDGNFTSVTVMEIDNFSKSNKPYSQEFTQEILKKVAFTLSLHQQATDVIARTDYNQFTVILSRASKDKLFKDMDNIRQSISELKSSSPETGVVTLSISGGFVIKPNNISLEESIKQSKKVLEFSQKHATNKIAQIKDLSEHEL